MYRNYQVRWQDVNTRGVGCKNNSVKIEVQNMLVLLNTLSLYNLKQWSMCLRKQTKNFFK